MIRVVTATIAAEAGFKRPVRLIAEITGALQALNVNSIISMSPVSHPPTTGAGPII